MKYPKISIVIPSYNQGIFLEECLLSIINQSYKNTEIIVMDGGSTDNSVDIIKKYEEYLYYWVSQKDGGQANAINLGWSMSTGDIITWLNSDDYYVNNSLSKVAKEYRYNRPVLYVGKCESVDINNNTLGVKNPEGYTWKTLLLGKSFGQPSVFISSKCEIKKIDSSLNYALDWDFFLKILYFYRFEKLNYINEILSVSREYEGTKTRTGLQNKGNERRLVLKRFFNKNPEIRKSMQNCALAGTYWVQASDQFLASKYIGAIVSVIRGLALCPKHFFRKIIKISWLIRHKVHQDKAN
jgi:glycosyltransferase involved in cell wall biosynthesis